MFRLEGNGGRNWYTIVDDCGCQASGSTKDLQDLMDQIVKATGQFKPKEEGYTVVLENTCNCEKVQMKLSKSAYNLLCYLLDNDWFDEDVHFTEINETEMEVFL